MSKAAKFNVTLVFVICLLCALCCGSAFADEAEDVSYTEVPVYIDGMLSCRGYSGDGETYVSLECVCGVLGYDVEADYNLDTEILTMGFAGVQLTAGTGDEYMLVNDRAIYLPNGYKEINGAFVFPLDAIAKIFSLNLSYNGGAVYFDTANEEILASGEDYYDEDDLYWMSRIITWESGNQPVEGQIGVGNVVLNRVESDSFADTVRDVIFQPGQFTPAMNGVVYGEPYEISVVCAKLVLEGYNTVGDALFFQVPRYGASADTASYVCTIADHHFFR